jgi:BMFP domain-containing protein YqiC
MAGNGVHHDGNPRGVHAPRQCMAPAARAAGIIAAVPGKDAPMAATNVLDQIMQTVIRLLPQTPEDARRNLHAALGGVLDRLDLVTREELEVQEAVLARTRARLQELEARIAELERQRRT